MTKLNTLSNDKFQDLKDDLIEIQNQLNYQKDADLIEILQKCHLKFAKSLQYYQLIKIYPKDGLENILDVFKNIDWQVNFYYKNLKAIKIYQKAFNQLINNQYQRSIDTLSQLEKPSDYQFLKLIDLNSLLNELRHTRNPKYKKIFPSLNQIRTHNPHTHVAINLVSLIDSDYQKVKLINASQLKQRLTQVMVVSDFLNQYQ